MNKCLISFVVYISAFLSLKGQCDVWMYDIYTPVGSQVLTYLTCEASTVTRMAFDDNYAAVYPNAQKIIVYDNLSSTRKFNCHGYAWLRVEQGIDRWIGVGKPLDYNPEKVYIQDSSYIEVPQETFPGKVVYWANNDHAAITTKEQGWVISKWNQYPLFRHKLNDSPYNSLGVKYYVKNCPAIGYEIVNFINQSPIIETHVKSCGDINTQNVNVQNGATLILDAVNTTIINAPFEVQMGSQLEIK